MEKLSNTEAELKKGVVYKKACNVLTRIRKKEFLNPLSANPEKWPNTLKQIVGNLPTICLSVFDHFMNLALKGLKVSLVAIYSQTNFLKRIGNGET